MPESKRGVKPTPVNADMSFVGDFAKCSICGKRKIIARQMYQISNGKNRVDIYLECKDCADIPL